MMIQVFTKQVYLFVALLALFSCFLVFSNNLSVFSGDLSEYEKKLEEAKKEKEEAESYLEYIKGEIHRIQNSGYSLDQQIRLMDEEMSKVEEEMEKVLEEIKEKEDYISVKEEELDKKQIQINKISDKLYRNSRVGFIDILFSTAHDNNMIHSLILNRFVIASQVEYMKGVANEVIALNTEKVELEVQKESFEKDQEEMDESKSLLAEQRSLVQSELNRQVAVRGSVSSRLGVLESEISELQKSILAAKSGEFVLSTGDVPATGNIVGTYQGFLDMAKPGDLAVFSIGAHTHRSGMSQYGAKARAEDGADYKRILNIYYPGTVENTATIDNISVVTCRDSKNRCNVCDNPSYKTYKFETEYLYRIAEMPESWHFEALKAQAVAARTYALRITNNGQRSIRDDQCHQVISTHPKTGAWKKAVDATAREVRFLGDSLANTQYSSTAGGFVSFDNKSLWDTTDGKDSGNWTSRAWESIAGSPWFYRAWYHLGGSPCGRNPWMTNEEMSDIINTWLVVEKGEGRNVNASRILPVTIKQCPVPNVNVPSNVTPYSIREMSSLLTNPVTRITGNPVVVRNSSRGITESISFPTNRGNISIPGSEFHKMINMRAPGYIHIPQSGFTHIDMKMK